MGYHRTPLFVLATVWLYPIFVPQNEMISDTLNISVYKQNIWTQKLGEESLAKALTYAHAANPSVRL